MIKRSAAISNPEEPRDQSNELSRCDAARNDAL
jgi:hypothetical protein